MPHAIICTGLSFAWPDGATVLSGLDLAIGAGPAGRTGLIGSNGSGKSTLLRLIAGELRPVSGSVRTRGDVGYLPQNLTLDIRRTVSDILGLTEVRAALHAIERGEATAANFAVVGDRWDVEGRAAAELARLGLGGLDLDAPVGRLSGGETVMVALAALFLRRPGVLLLDEPTNNLDLGARRLLCAAVAAWPGVMVIVSHDRELLGQVDQIADLSGGTVRIYGGNLAAYEEAVAVQREAAERDVRDAAADVRRQRREMADTQVRLARRQRYGKKMQANKREPRVIMQERKRQAQVSAGRLRETQEERLNAAQDRLAEAREAASQDAEIRVELPGTAVPAGRTVLTVTGLAGTAWRPARRAGTRPDPGEDRPAAGQPAGQPGPGQAAAGQPGPGQAATGTLDELIVRGPERIALTGPNGAGKTTLLRALAGQATLEGLSVRVTAGGTGYLPQRLDALDDRLSLIDNLRAAAPAASVNDVRAGLARFLFRGPAAGQLAGTLSGGERFRATLAALLLADPPPRLLLLDEPTNNLDMASVRQFAGALSAYRGAMIVASHDLPFLRSVGITRWLHLDPETGLTEERSP
jgi:ATPase subunit of ABC transporter with duplicated ATPase domains